MQNFIAEVAVEPKISFDLQNSQTIKNSNISNSSVSFSDFLAEAKRSDDSSTVKSEDNQNKLETSKEETKETNQDKSNTTEKVSEKTEEKSGVKDESKSEEKTDLVEKKSNLVEKITDSNEKKPVVEKNNGDTKNQKIVSKNKDFSNKIDENKITTEISKKTVKNEIVEEKKSSSKTLKSHENKKNSLDFKRLEELTEKSVDEKASETLISYVPVNNENIRNVKIEEKSEIKIEVNELSEITDNQIDETNLFESFKSEKVAYLDDEGKIIVKDQRTESVEEEVSEKNTKLFTTHTEFDNKNTATITMDLNTNANNVQSDVLSLNNQVASSDGSNFQSMLNNQIQANIPEFVKAGSIVLKDNNQGSINLVLHPDDLGNVKISLSLDGKSISGHIVVNTKEALEVFKENAQDLREAFIKNGFDAANFDVSYNDNSNNSQNNDFNNQFSRDEYFAKRIYSSERIDTVQEFSGIENLNEKFSEYSINIVA